jgi:hypothetical protein
VDTPAGTSDDNNKEGTEIYRSRQSIERCVLALFTQLADCDQTPVQQLIIRLVVDRQRRWISSVGVEQL